VRLGTSEVTRLGLKEREMRQVADYIKKVIIDKKKPEQVALEVKDFIKNFNVIKYTFTSSDEAYKYLSL
jgi:glycine hydroxymethyltransferase